MNPITDFQQTVKFYGPNNEKNATGDTFFENMPHICYRVPDKHKKYPLL